MTTRGRTIPRLKPSARLKARYLKTDHGEYVEQGAEANQTSPSKKSRCACQRFRLRRAFEGYLREKCEWRSQR